MRVGPEWGLRAGGRAWREGGEGEAGPRCWGRGLSKAARAPPVLVLGLPRGRGAGVGWRKREPQQAVGRAGVRAQAVRSRRSIRCMERAELRQG